MKNTKLFIYTLLACLILWVGFDISAARLKFGSATLNDSNSLYITSNKGFAVNGALRVSDTLRLSNMLRTPEINLTGSSPQILWTTYGMNIDGGIDVLAYNSNAHSFNTEYGTVAMYADTVSGLQSYLPGYSNNGRGLVKTKVLQSTLGGTTPGNYLTIAHGITNYRNIISYDMMVYEDSIGTWLQVGYNRSPGLTLGSVIEINATNCSWYINATAGNLKNAGDTVRWSIRYLE
jgi:hypothetical protein